MHGVKKVFIEGFGWWGTIAIVGAYGLSSFGILPSHTLLYQLFNLTGALGIITVSLYKKVYQSVALNLVWLIIAVIAIIRLFI